MVVTTKAINDPIHINKVSKLLTSLNIPFKTTSNYILSFIHRSLCNEKCDFAPEHNERLEFLGDAVLELVVTQNLFIDYPNLTEWELTDIRSSLVRWQNLALVSKKLKFSDYILMWKWEELSWGREKDYILANTVEAFIWAIYIDLWFEEAKNFIDNHIYSTISFILSKDSIKDYKSLIQEYAQATYNITPSYEVISHSWPDHDKIYVSWVYLKHNKIWEWSWSSKRKSQEDAAKNAFENKTSWIVTN